MIRRKRRDGGEARGNEERERRERIEKGSRERGTSPLDGPRGRSAFFLNNASYCPSPSPTMRVYLKLRKLTWSMKWNWFERR